MIIPDEIKKLIHEYIEKNGKRPLGFNYDEWNSFEEYKKYLEKELEKQYLLIVGAIFMERRCKYVYKPILVWCNCHNTNRISRNNRMYNISLYTKKQISY